MKRQRKQSLALFLALAVLLISLPLSALTLPVYAEGDLPPEEPIEVYELTDLREESIKQFYMGNGTYPRRRTTDGGDLCDGCQLLV